MKKALITFLLVLALSLPAHAIQLTGHTVLVNPEPYEPWIVFQLYFDRSFNPAKHTFDIMVWGDECGNYSEVIRGSEFVCHTPPNLMIRRATPPSNDYCAGNWGELLDRKMAWYDRFNTRVVNFWVHMNTLEGAWHPLTRTIMYDMVLKDKGEETQRLEGIMSIIKVGP